MASNICIWTWYGLVLGSTHILNKWRELVAALRFRNSWATLVASGASGIPPETQEEKSGHHTLRTGKSPCLLVGGIPTPLKNDGVRQLGWWHSQYMEGNKIDVPNCTNHQPEIDRLPWLCWNGRGHCWHCWLCLHSPTSLDPAQLAALGSGQKTVKDFGALEGLNKNYSCWMLTATPPRFS